MRLGGAVRGLLKREQMSVLIGRGTTRRVGTHGRGLRLAICATTAAVAAGTARAGVGSAANDQSRCNCRGHQNH